MREPDAGKSTVEVRHRRSARLVYTATALTVLAIPHTTVAQTQAPAVRVQRDYQLGQRTWPADLNRDGITDLVSSAPAGGSQVSIGRGDGTFDAPVASAFQGAVMAIGDFNGDGRPDVVASVSNGLATTFVILPGKGTATLGAAVTVASVTADMPFAVSADFNGDGKRDLVISDNNVAGVSVYPGNGDFTFRAPIALVTNGAAADAIVADLNNDGRRDLVVANGEGNTLSVFINRGAWLFSPSDIFVPEAINDVTVGDFNRDGRLDLAVAGGRPDTDSSIGHGVALVFRGNGDGTFAAPVSYPVATGAWQIVAGDFNRDGVLDLATGNRSAIGRDDCSGTLKTWDSVSILTGRTDGTFLAARNFSIGDQRLMDFDDPQVNGYRNTLLSLNTSDLNRDGATDLIASYGAILFNVPAVANRAPSVNAGPDTVLLNDNVVVLRPAASDPDEDMLTYEIRDELGHLVATYPNACYQSLHEEDNRFTVTVNDGHGHTASDSVVYTRVSTQNGAGQFATGNDIGRVGASGGDAVRPLDQRVYRARQRQRHLGHGRRAPLRVDAVVGGLPGHDARRLGAERERVDQGRHHDPGEPARRQPPRVAVRLAVEGGRVPAAPDGERRQRQHGGAADAGTRVAEAAALGRRDHRLCPQGDDRPLDRDRARDDHRPDNAPLVGLAVSSHVDGTVATARFSHVLVAGALPLIGRAIGTGTGSLNTDGVVYSVTGKGADIWGAADSLFYVSMPWENDVVITARVRSLTATHVAAKAGVMIRENLTAGSRHVMTIVTPGKGIAMQHRSAQGGITVQDAAVAGAAPAWVRLMLARATSTFTSSWSADGEHWTVLGSVQVPFSTTPFYIGLPVSSLNTSAFTTAVFDDVTVATPF